ncbi:uncharacterized protein LOC115274678 [Suricata suricatta]|uniref:uncharacterized protein LOC115274678 n=1 Tax=Suricata suricatta TaxID=37032 RepID=UPI0011559F2B|nr:uncharacterized protein LOC115274678 [Suricata suricatta]
MENVDKGFPGLSDVEVGKMMMGLMMPLENGLDSCQQQTLWEGGRSPGFRALRSLLAGGRRRGGEGGGRGGAGTPARPWDHRAPPPSARTRGEPEEPAGPDSLRGLHAGPPTHRKSPAQGFPSRAPQRTHRRNHPFHRPTRLNVLRLPPLLGNCGLRGASRPWLCLPTDPASQPAEPEGVHLPSPPALLLEESCSLLWIFLRSGLAVPLNSSQEALTPKSICGRPCLQGGLPPQGLQVGHIPHFQKRDSKESHQPSFPLELLFGLRTNADPFCVSVLCYTFNHLSVHSV